MSYSSSGAHVWHVLTRDHTALPTIHTFIHEWNKPYLLLLPSRRWLSSLVVTALDLRLDGRGFNFRPRRQTLEWVSIFGRGHDLSISPSHPGQLSLLPSAGRELSTQGTVTMSLQQCIGACSTGSYRPWSSGCVVEEDHWSRHTRRTPRCLPRLADLQVASQTEELLRHRQQCHSQLHIPTTCCSL